MEDKKDLIFAAGKMYSWQELYKGGEQNCCNILKVATQEFIKHSSDITTSDFKKASANFYGILQFAHECFPTLQIPTLNIWTTLRLVSQDELSAKLTDWINNVLSKYSNEQVQSGNGYDLTDKGSD